MSQTLDRFFRKFQDHLQTQGNKINLNDDYNKNAFIIATTKIIMNKNICMYTCSNAVPESPSPWITQSLNFWSRDHSHLLYYITFNLTRNLIRALILLHHPQSSLIWV